MFPFLEELEHRDCPSVSPSVTIIGVNIDANEFIPMVQVMLGDNTTLLRQAGYDVGHGSISSVLNLPTNGGSPTTAQISSDINRDIVNGIIPNDSNSLVLVFLGYRPSDAPATASAFHTGGPQFGGPLVPTTFTWTQAWESVPAFHEFDEALADMAGAGFEICDPVNWQSEFLDGFNISNFVLPNGTPAFVDQDFIGNPFQITPFTPPIPISHPSPPTIDSLFILGIERIRADIFGILARFNSSFVQPASIEAQQVVSNSWYGTPYGNLVIGQADTIVGQILEG